MQSYEFLCIFSHNIFVNLQSNFKILSNNDSKNRIHRRKTRFV